MKTDSPTTFTRLADGTVLLRQADGTYAPVKSETDHVALAKYTEGDIEQMAMNDPDHPGFGDAVWADFDAQTVRKEAISIKLDGDILSFFRQEGRGYQTRINAVLRRYVETHR